MDGSGHLSGVGEVEVVTFGCRLNATESEALRTGARAEGVRGVVVFNTCAVTAEAVRQARQAIRRTRRMRPDARLVVTGCAAQIEPHVFAAMPEVDLVLGNGEKLAPGALTDVGPRVRVGDIFRRREAFGSAGSPQGRVRAYVEIQNGCDHRCTFCVIPYGRGNSRSVAIEAVIARVRGLAAAGFAEVVLTGVDLTSWGVDFDGKPGLGRLVGAILDAVPELRRLRLSSLDAAEIDGELTDRLASEARLMPHLHLSLQSGDDLVLKRMKRRHSRAQALDLIAAVRRARPQTAFGADFIVGFPTETEAAFERTLGFVEEAQLAFLHVFPFNPRPSTPAARMPQVPPTVAKGRAARLREAGRAALARRLEAMEGARLAALVEREGFARAEDFTEVGFTGEAPPGCLIAGIVRGNDGRRALLDAWERTA